VSILSIQGLCDVPRSLISPNSPCPFRSFHPSHLSSVVCSSALSASSLMAPPNALFSTFSFIGFLFCAIPLYWHLKGKLRPTRAVLSVFHKIDRTCPSRFSFSSSVKCRHFLVYCLVCPWLFERFHQLGRLEPLCGECGPRLV